MSKKDQKKSEKDWEKLAKEAEEIVEVETDETDEEEAEGGEEAVALGGVLEHPSYKQLEAKLTEAEQQAHEAKDKAMRAMAELDNVRRRAERDVEVAHKYGTEKLIEELLPVIDSLEQALQSTNGDDDAIKALREGVELTLKMFLDAFAKFKITQIDPLGEVFDPHLHEAMSTQEVEGAKPNTIVTVFQKGYRLNDRIIRPARVVVAKG